MKECGVLLHISSLPSIEGIGTLGKGAYEFVDWLSASGFGYWQVLPIGHTGFGDSPYQSFSMYAGNPYFVDLAMACGEDDMPLPLRSKCIDYGKLYVDKYNSLRGLDFDRIIDKPGFEEFCRLNYWWLDNYAVFMAIKDSLGGASWDAWEDKIRFCDIDRLARIRDELSNEIRFYKYIQYIFFEQWTRLRRYANDRGVKIIGDIPIYTAYDSADVWANPKYFRLGNDLRLKEVAGVPPDYFSKDGQIWGNPLYDWDAVRADGYKLWTDRLDAQAKLYDVLRIDHFRGFAGYFVVDAKASTAAGGHWEAGPREDVFAAWGGSHSLEIVAEDLGTLTDDVYTLLSKTGFAGTKVLQFSLSDKNNPYLPDNYTTDNCVVYTGTHDNVTTVDWYEGLKAADRAKLRKYLAPYNGDNIVDRMIEWAYSSRAKISIIPMQDLLGLGKPARMNTPSVPGGNWRWRMDRDSLSAALSDKMQKIGKKWGRVR